MSNSIFWEESRKGKLGSRCVCVCVFSPRNSAHCPSLRLAWLPYTQDYLNLALQRPITSPWQTSSALNSEPSSVRYISKYTR